MNDTAIHYLKNLHSLEIKIHPQLQYDFVSQSKVEKVYIVKKDIVRSNNLNEKSQQKTENSINQIIKSKKDIIVAQKSNLNANHQFEKEDYSSEGRESEQSESSAESKAQQEESKEPDNKSRIQSESQSNTKGQPLSQNMQNTRYEIKQSMLFCFISSLNLSQQSSMFDRRQMESQIKEWTNNNLRYDSYLRDIKQSNIQSDQSKEAFIRLDYFVHFSVFRNEQKLKKYIQRRVNIKSLLQTNSHKLDQNLQHPNKQAIKEISKKIQEISERTDRLIAQIKDIDYNNQNIYLYFETYSNNENTPQNPQFGDDYPHKTRIYNETIIQVIAFNFNNINNDEDKKIIQQIHQFHKTSFYACFRNCEQRLKEIAYNSFKDIIRYSHQKVSQGDLGTNIQGNKDKDSTFMELVEGIYHQLVKKIPSESEVQSIVYKNVTATGILPINIYLVNQDSRLFKFSNFISLKGTQWIQKLFNITFGLQNHLQIQIMNKLYSYGSRVENPVQRIEIFECSDMPEFYSGLINDKRYIKLNTLDFFPHDFVVDEISKVLFDAVQLFQSKYNNLFKEEYFSYCKSVKKAKLSEEKSKENNKGILYYEKEQFYKNRFKQVFYDCFQEVGLFQKIAEISFEFINSYEDVIFPIFSQWAILQTEGESHYRIFENNCQTSISEFVQHIVQFTYESQDGLDPEFIQDYIETEELIKDNSRRGDNKDPLFSDSNYFKEQKQQLENQEKKLQSMQEELITLQNKPEISSVALDRYQQRIQNLQTHVSGENQFFKQYLSWKEQDGVLTWNKAGVYDIRKSYYKLQEKVFLKYANQTQNYLKKQFYPFLLFQIVPFHNYYSERTHTSYLRLLRQGQVKIEYLSDLIQYIFDNSQDTNNQQQFTILKDILQQIGTLTYNNFLDPSENQEHLRINMNLEEFKRLKNNIQQAIKGQQHTHTVQHFENNLIFITACEQWLLKRKMERFKDQKEQKYKLQVKDIFKELTYYYYNSIRLQNSLSYFPPTQKDYIPNQNTPPSFQCIGFLVCRTNLNKSPHQQG